MPLSAADRSRVADIQRSLAVYTDGGPAGCELVLAPLRELLRFDLTISYGVEEVGQEFRMSFAEAEGGCGVTVVRSTLGSFVNGGWVGRFTGYNPRRPEPWSRNRVVEYADFERRGVHTSTPITEVAFPRLGVHVMQQFRVLLCEGASLLAWVGGFRDVRAEPYTQRDRRAFGALIPSLRRRLTLERTLASAGTTRVALEVAMDAIAGPAFLLNEHGAPVLVNAAGRAALDADPVEVRGKLRTATRNPNGEWFRVTPILSPGCPQRYLAVERATSRTRATVQAAAQRWGLSPRQSQVLSWLVEGASNARVGAELCIAERTVETHVTAILHRAQASSRAELIAEVLKG